MQAMLLRPACRAAGAGGLRLLRGARAPPAVVPGVAAAAAAALRHASRSFASAASGEELVLVEHPRPAVAVFTLNRPKALNALSDALMAELVSKLKEFDADDSLRAAVVTGTGKAFAAGADIKEMNSRPGYADVRHCNMLEHWSGVSNIRKPVIAAINGFALGGGCELAMSCDILVASEDAKFGQPEIKLGTIPGVGGTQRLIRAVGKSKAMELILTGDMISAAEAERRGLVSCVVPSGQALEEALKMAEKIAAFSAPVTQLAKEAVNVAAETSLAEGLRFERHLFHATWALEDRKEGFEAFAGKRQAEFKHR